MNRTRRIIRRVLIAVLAVAVLGLLVLGLANYVILPRYGAQWVKAGLEESLGRTVTFEQVDWNVLRGATITGLVVRPRADVQSDRPFLKAERVEARFRIASLIPFRVELTPDLDTVTVHLIKTAGGTWNVADLVDRLSRKPPKEPTARVSRLTFSRMTIAVEDRYSDLPAQSLEDVSCVLTAPRNRSNHLALTGRWHNSPGRVTLDARFGPEIQPLFNVLLPGPVVTKLQQLLAPEGPIFVHEAEGLARIALMRTDNGKLTGRGQLTFTHIALDVEGFDVAGEIEGPIGFDVTPGDAPALTIAGTLTLRGGTVQYIPKPPLQSDPSTAAPSLRDVENAPADNDDPASEPPLTVEGDADVGLLLAGPIGERFSITVSCALGHAAISTPAVRAPIETISGRVVYDGTGLSFKDIVGEIEGAVVTANGTIDAFGNPNITFDVQGERLGGSGRIKIRQVEGRRAPAFQVDGAAWADATLASLVLPPETAETLERLQLSGMVIFEGRVAGAEPGIENLRARGQIGGVGLGVRGFGFEGMSGTFYLERGLMKIYGLDAILYDGRFTGAWETDFAAEQKPFKLDAALRDVEIAKTPLLAHVEERQLHGRLGFEAHVNGRLDDLTTSFGKGTFKLKNGYVWEFKVFTELFKVLSLHMPGLVKATFTEARADFRVDGLALKTENLYFKSSLLRLLMNGSIDLDGNLDVVVDPLFFREKGGPIQNLARQFLNIPANVIPRALIKGTVREPKVKPYLRPRLPIIKEILR